MTKIFVYGTLMDGECNHHLLQNLPYRRAYAENLALHNLGSYPAATGGEGTVCGEVYEVDRETLRKLAGILQCGEKRYRRGVDPAGSSALSPNTVRKMEEQGREYLTGIDRIE